jgi:hypothetical protein
MHEAAENASGFMRGQPFTKPSQVLSQTFATTKEVKVETKGHDRYQRTIADVILAVRLSFNAVQGSGLPLKSSKEGDSGQDFSSGEVADLKERFVYQEVSDFTGRRLCVDLSRKVVLEMSRFAPSGANSGQVRQRD